MTTTSGNPYPDEEFPWNFYFNGVLMPKWGACWSLAPVTRFLTPEQSWDENVGHRDIYLINCSIDHVGAPASADPDVFIYAAQEVLCILLGQNRAVMGSLRSGPFSSRAEEILQGLISAALQMRSLAREQRMAFWTSGYEADRLQLVERMERARWPESDPRHEPPPHLSRLASDVRSLIKLQESALHRLAQSGGVPKDLRRKLHAI